VLKVSDGDTLQVIADGSRFTVRLAGIDAPETKQEFGPEASMRLQTLVSKQSLDLRCFKTDRYQRKVCRAYLNAEDIALSMLTAGAAWVYREYIRELTPEERERYLSAEEDAQITKKGLWNGRPVAPWLYRQQNRQTAP